MFEHVPFERVVSGGVSEVIFANSKVPKSSKNIHVWKRKKKIQILFRPCFKFLTSTLLTNVSMLKKIKLRQEWVSQEFRAMISWVFTVLCFENWQENSGENHPKPSGNYRLWPSSPPDNQTQCKFWWTLVRLYSELV